MTVDEIIQAGLRRWWLVLLPALLAAGLTIAIGVSAAPRYAAEWRLMIGPIDTAGDGQSDGWDVTERVIDDLPAVINSSAFAEAAAAGSGGTLTAATLRGSYAVTPLHRSLTLRVSRPSAAEAEAALQAATDLLTADGMRYWGRSGGMPIVVLDRGAAAEERNLRGLVIDSGLRAALGLAAGWAAALWLERMRRPAGSGRR
jgi:hypothetical protein